MKSPKRLSCVELCFQFVRFCVSWWAWRGINGGINSIAVTLHNPTSLVCSPLPIYLCSRTKRIKGSSRAAFGGRSETRRESGRNEESAVVAARVLARADERVFESERPPRFHYAHSQRGNECGERGEGREIDRCILSSPSPPLSISNPSPSLPLARWHSQHRERGNCTLFTSRWMQGLCPPPHPLGPSFSCLSFLFLLLAPLLSLPCVVLVIASGSLANVAKLEPRNARSNAKYMVNSWIFV